MSTDTGHTTAPATPEGLKPAFRWFLVGFGLLGLCVGYFAGNSDSPVISVLLPLLFGLVGGAGGFYLAGANLAAPETVLRLRFLGVALTVFTLLLIVGSAYGVLLRTGLGLSSFFPRSLVVSARPADLPALDQKNAHEAIQLVLMRGRLKALGASEDEQRLILDRLVKDQVAFDAPLGDVPSLLRLATLMERAVADLPQEAGDKAPGEIVDTVRWLEAYSRDYKRLAGQIQGGEKVPAALVAYYLTTVQGELDRRQARWSGEVLAYLKKQDNFRRHLTELRWSLLEEGRRLQGHPALDRPQVVQEVDQFLALMYGGSGKGGENPLLWKPQLGPQFKP
jgi:hypothetical protein